MKQRLSLLITAAILLCACAAPEAAPEPTTPPVPTETPFPDEPTQTGAILNLPTPVVGTVALDFVENPCSASWSNNGEYLPCPGNLDDIDSGYADRFEDIIIEGDIHINKPGLLTIPAQAGSGYYAIFGKYPPFTVQAGDRFRAVLACANGHPGCDAVFSLEYYASSNKVIQIPDAKWEKKYDPAGSYIYADASLDSIAGQTVQLLLAVRDNGNAEDDYAVWIMPHIARLGGAATDAIPPNQLNINNIETVTVSGTVDMSSAPPYLYDDHPPGSPASVVFFDLNSDMFFTVSTKDTHPEFSIDVYPGEYYVVAYSYGVGDVPYVSGTFTGFEPSCGKPMAALNVLPDTPVTNLTINDWNWSCGGKAERLAKPEEVSLP